MRGAPPTPPPRAPAVCAAQAGGPRAGSRAGARAPSRFPPPPRSDPSAALPSFKFQKHQNREKGDSSDLHIIIFDEIDAICKARGSSRDGTGVHDTIVNQLLTKIDGVDALNNILLIGMTNRKDMLDEAMLRPGRLEVMIEIGLPDEKGRLQILKIHTSKVRRPAFRVLSLLG